MFSRYAIAVTRRIGGIVGASMTALGFGIWLSGVFPRWGVAAALIGLIALNVTQYLIFRDADRERERAASTSRRSFTIESSATALTWQQLENRLFLMLPDVYVVNHTPDLPTVLRFDLILDWTDGAGQHWHSEYGKDPFQSVYQWSSSVQSHFLSNPLDAPANKQGNLGFLHEGLAAEIPDQLRNEWRLRVTEEITGESYEISGPGRYRFPQQQSPSENHSSSSGSPSVSPGPI